MKVFAALLAAAAGLLAATAPAAEERRANAARLMDELMSGKVQVGGAFTLTDPQGRKIRLSQFRGRMVLLYFGFARCPDICPTDLFAIGATLKSLGADGKRIQPLFVTLDPARDRPQVLREYVASFHPRFIALSGSEAEVRAVAERYKVFYEKVPVPGSDTYTIDHAAFTFLLDRDGKYLGLFPPGTPPERMSAILREHLRAL